MRPPPVPLFEGGQCTSSVREAKTLPAAVRRGALAVARVERRGGRRRVVAESPEELALLRHGERTGGELVLLEACYPVHGDALVLPDTISAHGARRVREALEQAASSHREAEQRRKRFRLVQE